MGIVLENIQKKFGTLSVVNDISLEVKSGELLAILGPSGSGKTSMLRVIAGLEFPEAGRIFINGMDASTLSVRERRIGFVFQHYAMFRHMNVFENIAFGMRVRPKKQRPSEVEINKKVSELLELVQIKQFANYLPAELSGGQRQRVALARVLAIDPKVLLLDEPFGALDARVRKDLRRWLRNLHNEMHVTSILVTHDQEEAMEVADRIVILNKGKIEQIGTPEEVYKNPANEFVCSFLGHVNKLDATIEDSFAMFGNYKIPKPNNSAIKEGSRVKLYVRSNDFIIRNKPDESMDYDAISAEVIFLNIAGVTVKAEVRLADGATLEIDISHSDYEKYSISKGSKVFLYVRRSLGFYE